MKKFDWLLRVLPVAMMVVCLAACGSDSDDDSGGPVVPGTGTEIEQGWGAGKTDVWDGSSDISWYDPELNLYQLKSAAQLAGFAELVNAGTDFRNKTVTLEVNVRMNDRISFDENHDVINSGSLRPWTPIGNEYPRVFNGTFDGKKHVISGMYINRKQDYAAGLFSRVGNGSENKSGTSVVKNIGIVNSYVEGGDYAGAVVGSLYGSGSYPVWNSEVLNCYSDCVVKARTAGGIVGRHDGKNDDYNDVEGCFNKGYVEGSENAGGIVGDGGTIKDSYNKGYVSGKKYSGGIAGTSRKVIYCHNLGTVTGGQYCAGISGFANKWPNFPAIEFCYNRGLIKGSNILCGIAGIYHGSVVSCYSNNYFEIELPVQYPAKVCGIAGVGHEGLSAYGSVYNSYSVVNCNTYNHKEVEGHSIKITGGNNHCYSKYNTGTTLLRWSYDCEARFNDNSGILIPSEGYTIIDGCTTLIDALNAYSPGKWKVVANENDGYPVFVR